MGRNIIFRHEARGNNLRKKKKEGENQRGENYYTRNHPGLRSNRSSFGISKKGKSRRISFRGSNMSSTKPQGKKLAHWEVVLITDRRKKGGRGTGGKALGRELPVGNLVGDEKKSFREKLVLTTITDPGLPIGEEERSRLGGRQDREAISRSKKKLRRREKSVLSSKRNAIIFFRGREETGTQPGKA